MIKKNWLAEALTDEAMEIQKKNKYISKCPHKYRGCNTRYMLQECEKCGHHRGHHQKYVKGCSCAECDERETIYGSV